MGGIVGLDYPGVYALMQMYGVKNQRALIRKLQDIEQGALRIFHA